MTPCPHCGQIHDSTGCPSAPPYELPPVPTKWPFRCPVCEGKGTLPYVFDGFGLAVPVCHACAGTGIVWGPP